MKIKLLGILALIFLSLHGENHAQTKKISFKHYTINEGLSQNTVLCILVDHYGFIWIGTEDGLNKFDGYEFTIYRHDNKNKKSISNNQINALHEDKEGNIWIGTAKGLNVFDRKKEIFKKVVNKSAIIDGSGEYITSFEEAKNGDIWIGSLGDFKRYDKKTKKVTVYKLPPTKEKDQNRIHHIYLDEKSLLWLSKGKGLKVFNPKTNTLQHPSPILRDHKILQKSFIRTIQKDDHGNVWIGTEFYGVFVYNKKRNSLRNLSQLATKNGLPINAVREIFIKNKDEVWLGTREGLVVYHIKQNKFTNYVNDKYDLTSISHNIIRCITKDKANNYWIGTYSGGLNMVSENNNFFSLITENFGNKQGLSSKVVNAICYDKDGKLWVGTESRGLNLISNNLSSFKTFLFTNYNPNTSNTVKAIMSDNHQLWIGTLSSLWRMDTAKETFKEYKIPENNGVYTLEKTNKGIWVGTNGSGILLLQDNGEIKQFKYNEKQEGLVSNHITKIYKDKKENLWIATPGGLSFFNGTRFYNYRHLPENEYSLSNSSVQSIFIDSKDRIWIGTRGGGLNFFDARLKKFYALTTQHGLANDVIQDIKEDKNGNLWLSSNKGLSKLSFHKFKAPFNEKDYKIINYYFEDGLQSNQFITGSSTINQEGKLFFGGINGISYFDPEQITINKFKAPVVLTEFQIRNKKIYVEEENSPLTAAINEVDKIVLSNNQAFFSVKFSALNYINPTKNQYQYKLDGLGNEDWHIVNNQRVATYTNLDAGTYYLNIKAANNDGLWNEQAKVLKIIVLPPWWKSWWAYLLYASIIATLLYLYYFYSLKTAKLKNDLYYEHLIREKDQELYQQKLNFFTNISHEIKTPITLILAPLEKLIEANTANNKINNQLMMMKRNGERLMRLINQLLDFRKFESGNMKLQVAEGNIIRFLKEITYSFQSYAKHLGINLKIESDESSIKLWFDRDKFEKIFYNLISNALKFNKKGGEVIIRVKTKENQQVLIEVVDNGIGIAETNIKHIFDQFINFNGNGEHKPGHGIGLSFTKILVELHKGTISVASKEAHENENGFTTFTITLPLGNQHFKPEEIISNYKNSEDIQLYYQLEASTDSIEINQEKYNHILEDYKGEKPILLIVEDNKDVLSFLVNHFEEKFHIHTARNGKEGINKALELLPDIIISDVMMPETSGTTLCSTLKKDHRTSHIPIILLTARTPIIYKIEGLETGADDYLTKPFSIKILETRVWNLLEIRQKLRDRYKKEVTLQPLNIAVSSTDEVLLEKIMKFIETHISDPKLSVEDLCKEVFMSRVTLYRKIKALTNQTPVEFIRGVRLKRAAQLLATKKHHISEVAYMVGFLDLNYFRRCFKEEFGKTPKEFAETNS
ncbi:hybrid sensor histidine kinase/response regulator transcription factor [Pedobacter glucosidilyticus]|uniref:hybrid sensor histidine kinase/response regulator transcription factor n=1 Tax=Pedobacter glucosidilyticus TaxID=1122941 RepID=UPI0026EE3C19|nr:two-component regulator propeller domain-containing protein [Pedobacter glucosidilyticus]